jgi:glycosyltransferase involved in cell wall biosynthesis
MTILLAAWASYEPPRGGSTRSNLAWLRQLSANGHRCVVLSRWEEGETATVDAGGVEVRRVREASRIGTALESAVGELNPDWVLISSEDVSHTLIRAAWKCAAGRVIYVAHTPQFFPFGPESWAPDRTAAALVKQCAAIITISVGVSVYVREHLAADSVVVHPPVYGQPPYPDLADFNRRAVLMVNPCDVKGLPIFLALAARMPEVPFLALAGWGTNRRDREAMARQPNVRVLEPVARIEDALSQASVVLVPSLWFEGFGLAATEAMLRGLPVLAADHGGLREAMTGTGGLVPVAPLPGYEPHFDDRFLPRAIVPPQPIDAWDQALRPLLTDRVAYERHARACRASAEGTVARVPKEGIEPVIASVRSNPLADLRRRLLEKKLAERREGRH